MNATDKNDGGPAFPHDNQELGNGHRMAQCGMSLRDYLAGQALIGMLASETEGIGMCPDSESGVPYERTCAGRAYEFADAMLAAREHPDS